MLGSFLLLSVFFVYPLGIWVNLPIDVICMEEDTLCYFDLSLSNNLVKFWMFQGLQILFFQLSKDSIRESPVWEIQHFIHSMIGVRKLLILISCHLQFGLIVCVPKELYYLWVLFVHPTTIDQLWTDRILTLWLSQTILMLILVLGLFLPLWSSKRT